MQLTEQDKIHLRWMIEVNDQGKGFLKKSVRKFGDLPEMEGLVEAGYCYESRGYWVTQRGRAALATTEGQP
jgi:hypothetical protein